MSSEGAASFARDVEHAVPSPHRDHRRGHHRLQHRLPLDRDGRDGRGVAGEASAHRWGDVARRRIGRAVAFVAQHDAHARAFGRVVRTVGSGDGAGSRLASGRKPSAGVLARTRDGVETADDDGEELRSADGDRQSAARPRTVSIDDDRRCAGRGLSADRRVHRPRQCHAGDRQGCADAQRADLREHEGHIDHGRGSTRHDGAHGSGATSPARWSSTPQGCGAWRSAAWRACEFPPLLSSTSTC